METKARKDCGMYHIKELYTIHTFALVFFALALLLTEHCNDCVLGGYPRGLVVALLDAYMRLRETVPSAIGIK